MKKKCARLKTAGGFHSPLMTSASEVLANYFAGSDAPVFNEAEITLICNTDAAPFVVSEPPSAFLRRSSLRCSSNKA